MAKKSEAFIVERVVAIVTAVQERYPLALAVVACNTASTVSLPALREKFDFPVVGVVPAIKTCCTSDGKWHCRITGTREQLNVLILMS